MNADELAQEALRLSRRLERATDTIRDQAPILAGSEHDYRKAKAQAWLSAPEGTVPEREAHVQGVTAELRRARDYAQHMQRAAIEASRNMRQQISVLQSIAKLATTEVEAFAYGPQETP